MKKHILTLFLLVTLSQIQAQTFLDSTEVKINNNELGAHAGFTTGLGLSYRHWFNKVGLQFTTIPVKTDEAFFLSLGFTGMYSLKKTNTVRTYLYVGNHLISNDEGTGKYQTTGSYKEITTRTTRYNIGFGPGFAFGRTVTYNIQFGYGLYDITGKFNMLPTLEMGLYYKF